MIKYYQKMKSNLINEISNKININDIGLFWQFTIKTIEDLKILNDDR